MSASKANTTDDKGPAIASALLELQNKNYWGRREWDCCCCTVVYGRCRDISKWFSDLPSAWLDRILCRQQTLVTLENFLCRWSSKEVFCLISLVLLMLLYCKLATQIWSCLKLKQFRVWIDIRLCLQISTWLTFELHRTMVTNGFKCMCSSLLYL